MKTRRLEVMCLHLRARPDGMETKLYILEMRASCYNVETTIIILGSVCLNI